MRLLALDAPAEAELAAHSLSLRRLTTSVLISRPGGGFPAMHASATVNHDVLASHETQLPQKNPRKSESHNLFFLDPSGVADVAGAGAGSGSGVPSLER